MYLQVLPCTWTHCLDPILPEGKNLTLQPNVTEVPIFRNATYACESGTWFHHDRDVQSFNVTCLDNNVMAYPPEWHFCVASKYNIQGQ